MILAFGWDESRPRRHHGGRCFFFPSFFFFFHFIARCPSLFPKNLKLRRSSSDASEHSRARVPRIPRHAIHLFESSSGSQIKTKRPQADSEVQNADQGLEDCVVGIEVRRISHRESISDAQTIPASGAKPTSCSMFISVATRGIEMSRNLMALRCVWCHLCRAHIMKGPQGYLGIFADSLPRRVLTPTR